MGQRRNKTKFVGAWVTPAEFDALRSVAARLGTNNSDALRTLVNTAAAQLSVTGASDKPNRKGSAQ